MMIIYDHNAAIFLTYLHVFLIACFLIQKPISHVLSGGVRACRFAHVTEVAAAANGQDSGVIITLKSSLFGSTVIFSFFFLDVVYI